MPPVRLPYLDALRGLAALSVVIAHIALMPAPNLPTPIAPTTLLFIGSTAVCLFFALSIFSLFYTMPGRLREARPVTSFYMRRFFRIAPLFYFWLGVRLFHDFWVGAPPHALSEIGANVFFVFNLIPQYVESLVLAGWTVGVEEVLYALFPAIYFLVRGVPSAVAFSVGAVLVAIGFNAFLSTFPPGTPWVPRLQTWSVLVHLQTFALGSVAFFVATRLEVGWMVLRRHVVGPVLTVGGTVLLAVFAGWPGVLPPYLPWQGLICLLLIVGLHFKAGRLFVNPVSKYLGRISFSFYLAHPLLVYYLIPVYRRIYSDVHAPALAFLACVLVTCAILIPIAEVTYRAIEVRGINAGREATRRLALRPRPQTDAAAAP